MGKATRLPRSRAGYVWKKSSLVISEDAWQERLAWLGQRLVMMNAHGSPRLRIEAHGLSRDEAAALLREHGGAVRTARPLSARDLEPKPRPPLRIRGELLIVSTEKERAIAAARTPRLPLLLIPATVAFGTGEHATTAACLRVLADVASGLRGSAWDALDIGTGSGILALAARIFGARKVNASDFDPVAVRVAKENAAANGITGVTFTRNDVLRWTPPRRWPVVLANVFSQTLIEAAPRIAASVADGGALILSGILRTQESDVATAFRAQRCRIERAVRRGKWVTLLARRSKA